MQGRAAPAMPPPVNVPSPTSGLADLVAAVKGAVVNVEVKQRATMPDDMMGADELFQQFFGRNAPRQQQQQPHEMIRQGAGSGVVIDSSGLVLTNNHVVEGATEITVTLDDGRKLEAKVLGHDPLTDLALVKLQGAEGLPVAKLGDSDAVRVGDWVVAIGNPYGLATSVSAGILSARARDIQAGPYDDFLQTDAAINPGNSGGPLFNLQGEVIGVNTAIVGGGTGIGFAVPSNMVLKLLPQLKSGKAISRGYLGVAIQDLTPALGKALNVPVQKGAVIADVTSSSPAASSGLKANDVVVSVDGQEVKDAKSLTRAVGFLTPGKDATLTVYRGGNKLDLKVKLGTRPDLEGLSKTGQQPGGEEGEGTKADKLGLKVQDGDAAGAGVGAYLLFVEPGSPAEKADLRPNMLITEVNGKPVRNAQQLLEVLHSAKPGATLLIKVQVKGGHVLRALTIP
ncbi:MAG: Do family serine endopeptidase [Myxococcaceae bacterium]